MVLVIVGKIIFPIQGLLLPFSLSAKSLRSFSTLLACSEQRTGQCIYSPSPSDLKIVPSLHPLPVLLEKLLEPLAWVRRAISRLLGVLNRKDEVRELGWCWTSAHFCLPASMCKYAPTLSKAPGYLVSDPWSPTFRGQQLCLIRHSVSQSLNKCFVCWSQDWFQQPLIH